MHFFGYLVTKGSLNRNGMYCRRDCTYTYSTCIHTNTPTPTHPCTPLTQVKHTFLSDHKWWLSPARQNSTRISCEIWRCNSSSVQVNASYFQYMHQWLQQQVALLSQLLPPHLPMWVSSTRKPSVQRSDELSPPLAQRSTWQFSSEIDTLQKFRCRRRIFCPGVRK